MILLVDDQPEVRLMASVLLDAEGMAFEEACSGEQALDLSARRDYDLIVLDHRMPPGLTGIQVAERLRGAGSETPIILYSAYLDREVEHQARQLHLTTVDKADPAGLIDEARRALGPPVMPDEPRSAHAPVPRRPVGTRHKLFTPPTPAVAAARTFTAHVRLALATLGGLLLALRPDIHPHPAVAAVGLLMVAALSPLRQPRIRRWWLRVQEPLALVAGVLLVSLGPAGLSPLATIWLSCAALGVMGRGGRTSVAGRVLVLAVLASPMLRGSTPDAVAFLGAGCGLLLGVGRISNETAELLRDPLTGVLSRAVLEAEAERYLRAARRQPPAVVLVDLDDFGQINKSHGHSAGDAVLRTATHAMAMSLRHSDVLGRLGGDEFVVIAVGDPSAVATRTLRALRDAGVAASAGYASSSERQRSFADLLASADAGLREAKSSGKGGAAGANPR